MTILPMARDGRLGFIGRLVAWLQLRSHKKHLDYSADGATNQYCSF